MLAWLAAADALSAADSWWGQNSHHIIVTAAVVVTAVLLTVVARAGISRGVERLTRAQAARQRRQAKDTPPLPTPQAHAVDVSRERAQQRTRTLGSVLRNTATIAIWVTAILIVLGEFSISLAPLIAGAGVVGVALGFGAQTIVRDVLAGIFILFEDQYGVGDVVDLGEAIGTVEEVTLRVTRLRDVEGTVWYVPNGEIRRAGNLSQYWARALLDIGIAYDSDIELASTVIKRVADEVWRESLPGATVLEEPELWGVEQLGPDAVVIRLVIKTKPGEQWAVSRLIRQRLKTAFDEAGVEIPFPQRTVWLREQPADADGGSQESP